MTRPGSTPRSSALPPYLANRASKPIRLLSHECEALSRQSRIPPWLSVASAVEFFSPLYYESTPCESLCCNKASTAASSGSSSARLSAISCSAICLRVSSIEPSR